MMGTLQQHRAALLLMSFACICSITLADNTQLMQAPKAATDAALPCDGAIGKTVVQQFTSIAAFKLPPELTALFVPEATRLLADSWSDLVTAVQEAKKSSTTDSLTVFELQNDVIATSTLQLQPGMAVVGKGAAGKTAVACGVGVPSAFVINMTADDTRDVLLHSLQVRGCSNSAVVVNGSYGARMPLSKASPGLIISECTFSSNTAAAEGGAILAWRAALYLHNTQFSSNSAGKFGGAVRINAGLLVAASSIFKANAVGFQSTSLGTDEGSGAAIYATNTAVSLFRATVAGNKAEALGGCAVAVTGSQPVLISGCNFTENTCSPNLLQRQYQNIFVASTTCNTGGASLRVLASGASPDFTMPVDCKGHLDGQNTIVLVGSSFARDTVLRAGICGGAVMAQMAWLEVHSSTFSDSHGSAFGGALGALTSNVIIANSSFRNHSSTSIGGAITNPIGRLWMFHSNVSDSYAALSGGGIGLPNGIEMQLHSVEFVQCSAAVAGGAVWFELISVDADEPPLLTVHKSRFLNCSAGKEAGALSTSPIALDISDCDFIQCKAYYGAVVTTLDGPIRMSGTRFINNTARSGGQGGSLNVYNPPYANFTNCTWIGNTAYQGGAILAASDPGVSSEWLFDNCHFERNSASQFGGVIWATGTNITSLNTKFISNTALAGGCVHATGYLDDLPLHVSIEDCLLGGNSAGQSGGVAFLSAVARFAVLGSTVTRSTAKLAASGFYLQDTNGLIEDSNFTRNVAQSAAVMMIEGDSSVVSIRRSQFSDNKAGDRAGAIQVLRGSLDLRDTTFSRNQASSAAGAILLLHGSTLNCTSRCVLDSNTAAVGAAIAAELATLQLADTYLKNNRAASDLITVTTSRGQQDAACGGGIWADSSRLLISASEFGANWAGLRGGAVHLLNSTATIKRSRFSGNVARISEEAVVGSAAVVASAQTAGGGIYSATKSAPVASNEESSNSSSGMGEKISADLLLYSCIFSGNIASVGGAVAVADKGTLSAGAVSASTADAAAVVSSSSRKLQQHQADYKGNVQLPLPATGVGKTKGSKQLFGNPSIVFYSSLFVNNTAYIGSGGAFFSNLVGVNINISSSNFSSNRAAQGGGAVAAVHPAAINMQESYVSSNLALYCGGLLLYQQQQPSMITGSSFMKNKASLQPGNHLIIGGAPGVYKTAGESSYQRSFGQLPTYRSTSSGGGLCVVPGAVVSISDSDIRQNTALHGAGMFIEDSCSNSSACSVTISDSTILGPNQALPGGSGSSYYTTAASTVKASRTVLVKSAADNSSGATGIATSPYRLVGGLAGRQSNASLILDSGDAIGAVQLQLQDEFGSLVKSSVLERLTFVAQAVPASAATKSDTQLIGVTSTIVASPASRTTGNSQATQLTPGNGRIIMNDTENTLIQFNNLELQGAPGEKFNVMFSVQEAPEVIASVIEVQLKPCSPGQAVVRGRDSTLFAGCTNCTNPLFSFDSTSPQCYPCPPPGSYSHCSGDLITPADGYWQSHPRSTQLLACPYKPACTRSLSTYNALRSTAADWCSMTQVSGSSSSLNPAQLEVDRVSLIDTYQQLQCAESYTGNLCGSCARDTRVSQATNRSCRPCQFSRLGSAILFTAARLLDLTLVLIQVAIVLWDRRRRQAYVDRDVAQVSESVPDGSAGNNQPGVSSYMLKGSLLLKEQQAATNPNLVEIEPGTDSIFAMLIEYMQLLSVLRLTRIGEFWRATAEAVLLALSITPISTYGWVSIECSLPAGMPTDSYAYYSTLATTLIPIALTLAVCAMVLAKNALQAKLRGFLSLRSYPDLVPELLLAAVKAVTYSYPIITGSVIGIFSCKRLDGAPTVAGELVAAQGAYWTKDLDTVCFGRKHAAFMLALGVPMLLLIIAYPAVQALLLARKARHQPDGLYQAKFWTNYSLLYEQYRPRMYLWGCLRDVRQLVLITLVVVLQSQPSAQIQLVAGWVLAFLLLGLQAAVMPFKTKLLNALQLAMLGSLAFTFYVGVISTVTGVPAVACSVLQYIAVLMDVGVALVLLSVLFWRARLFFDYDSDGKISWEDVKQTLRKHSKAMCTSVQEMLLWCLRKRHNHC